MKPDALDTGNEFEGPFWADDFQVDLEKFPGPLSVAQMTLANRHVPHDAGKFRENAFAIADKFVSIMRRVR